MYQHIFKTSDILHFESGRTPRISRYVVSDDPHWASGYHMHEDQTELIWVERGKFHMLASKDSDPAKTYACAVYGFKFHDLRDEFAVLDTGTSPVMTVTHGADTIRTLFRELDAMVTARSAMLEPLANTIATLLLVLFRENFKLAARPNKDKQLKNVLIREVLVYLNENFREKITLDALSKRFHASVSYIAHEFAREYGISPINYVIERRITEAKFALTTSTQSLNHIAWDIGYENTYHFSKLFQRHVGCSPSEYRRRFSKVHPDAAAADAEAAAD